MPIPKLLESISKKTEDIFVVTIENLEVIFRLPSYKQAIQYSVLLFALEEGDPLRVLIYDFIFSKYVEDNWLVNHEEMLHAGVPETVVKVMLYLSGSGEGDKETKILYASQILENQREAVKQGRYHHMVRVICSVFTGYTCEILEGLSYQRIIYIFAQAEQISIERGIIEKEYVYSIPEEKKESTVDFDQLFRDNKERNSFENNGMSPAERHQYNLHSVRSQEEG